MSRVFARRMRVLAGLFCLVACVIIGRLYMMQVVEGDEWRARADAQFSGPENPVFDRGSIYFSDKSGTPVLAATVNTGYLLALDPSKITDAEVVYAALSPLVSIDRTAFMAKATKKGSRYQIVVDHLSEATSTSLRAVNLPGVIVARDRWRYYPGGSLAAQEVGFVAYKGDALEGRYGLERYWQDTLKRDEDASYTNFFVELFDGARAVLSGAPQAGDVVTTIEPSVQAELEHTLAEYTKEWHPRLAGGIVMDPKTGEIYAMAVTPTFDLNKFGQEKSVGIFGNPMVEGVYEMGSIIKPLTMAAGIDSGAVRADSTYEDTGCITLDQKKICNFDLKARGTTPMQQVLSQSLNLGVSHIAGRMGSSTMRTYFLDRYKLGQETGIDLPNEAHGLVSPLQSPLMVNYATASFGQGIALSPIATIRALSALANNGKIVQPHLARSIVYTVGGTKTLAYGDGTEAMRPETALTVSRMLTEVVDTSLADGKIKLDRYSVAAKTGTAQIANPGGGGYYTDRYLHSFFGYFPSYDPKFVIFLFALEPVGAKYSSQTWAIRFHSLTNFLINYYAVPPDR